MSGWSAAGPAHSWIRMENADEVLRVQKSFWGDNEWIASVDGRPNEVIVLFHDDLAGAQGAAVVWWATLEEAPFECREHTIDLDDDGECVICLSLAGDPNG